MFLVSYRCHCANTLYVIDLENSASSCVCVIQRKRGDSDINDADCDLDESVKDEAAFEDKIVDMMVLEEPQNMYQSLEK